MLKGTEFEPTPEQVKAKIATSGQKAAKDYNTAVSSLWQHASSVSEADRIQLENRRQSLASQYGIPLEQLAEVPTSDTLGKKRLDETKRRNQETEKLSRERFSWMKDRRDKEFKERMSVSWYNAHTARQNMINAQLNGDLNAMRFYSSQFNESSDSLLKDIGKKMSGLEAALDGKRAALAKERPGSRKAREIQSSIEELQGQLDHWKKEAQEHNDDRSSVGMPTRDPSQIVQEAEEYAKQRRAAAPPASGGPKVVGVRKIR